MAEKWLKSVGTYLPGGLLQAMQAHLDEGSRLDCLWRAALRDRLAEHTRPVRYVDGELYVRADTSAWASRLRMSQGELLQRLKREPYFKQLRALHVRVAPLDRIPPVSAPVARRTRISASAAQCIRAAAAQIRDPGLRAALDRLGDDAARRAPRK